MDFTTYVDDPGKGVLFCDCISALINITPTATIDPLLQAASPGPQLSAFYAGSPSCPSSYFGISGGNVFVFINGTETLAQASSYWSGLTGGILPTVTTPINAYTLAAAGIVLTRLRTLLAGTTLKRVWFCGYSLGGAIASHAASQWNQADFSQVPVTWTIGSPRTLNVRDAEFVSQNQSVRWMIDNDPVPLIPPSFAQSPSTAILYGVRTQQRLNNFVHVGGGQQIQGTGTISAREIPDNAVWTATGTLSNFLFSEDGAFGFEHSIAEYRRRFVLWRTNNPLPRDRPDRPAPQEQPNPSPRREENQQAATVRRAINAQGEAQNSIPVRIPTANAFTVAREEGIWVVAFGDSVCAVAPTKRRARALARLGNEFLRRLLVQAVVDPIVLAGQLAAWTAAAEDPTSGITPTLQTGFPT